MRTQHPGLKLKEGVYIPPQVIDYPQEDPYAHLVKVEKSADTPDTYTFDETYWKIPSKLTPSFSC